jgi:hypothetical protein
MYEHQDRYLEASATYADYKVGELGAIDDHCVRWMVVSMGQHVVPVHCYMTQIEPKTGGAIESKTTQFKSLSR